jgi:predicted RNA-binding Zn ribbon-like protein
MPDFLFVANDHCLDLVNTEVMLDGAHTDLLQSFSDFAEWFERAKIAGAGDARQLIKGWGDTLEAKSSLQAARELRSLLRASVESVVNSGRVPDSLARVLTRHLRYPRSVTEVISTKGRLENQSRWLLEKPADLIVPVAHLAANFFSSADYSSIRKCENPDCILFFYDTSKNHTRRWCSMDLCGNRAKVAAFRERNQVG